MDLATKGEKALADSQAALAVQYYTRALLELPRAPNYYIQRSTAYSRLKPEDGGPKSDAALRDAEIAVTLAADRGSRELILSAQFRRAVSLFQLERYGDASFLLQMLDTKVNGQKEKMDRNAQVRNAMSASGPSSKHRLEAHVPVWIAKVNKKLGELADGDEKAAVSIVEYPKTKPLSKEELQAELSGKTQATVEKEEHTAAPAPTRSLPERTDKATTPTASVALEKIRHEWYQSTDSVVVTLYVKGVPKDRVQSELKDETVSATSPNGIFYFFAGWILTLLRRYRSSSLSHQALTTISPLILSLHQSTHLRQKSPSWVQRSKSHCRSRTLVTNGEVSKDRPNPHSLLIVPLRQQRLAVVDPHTRPRLVTVQKTGIKSRHPCRARSTKKRRLEIPRTAEMRQTLNPPVLSSVAMPSMASSRSCMRVQIRILVVL